MKVVDSTFEISSRLVETLRTARYVAVLTGAGISAESGVPTFRDPQTRDALWAKYKPEDLATREAFQRNPRTVWEWYASRREMLAQVAPNPGHLALAEMQEHVPRFTLITQNVDGLHQRAGSRQVIELHGNISRTRCFKEDTVITDWAETGEVPPRCPRCGARLRPDVVWYGELLPFDALQAALDAAHTCDLFFSIGTSAQVEPAASLPFEALEHGATVVEINPEQTLLSAHATFRLSGAAGQVLPVLLQATWPPA